MLNNLGIKPKLIIAFVFSASIALIVGITSYVYSSKTIQAYRTIAKDNVPNLVQFIEMRTQLSEAVIPVASLIGTPTTPEEAAKAKIELEKAIAAFNKAAKTYEDLPFAEGEEAQWNILKNETLKRFFDMSLEMIRLSGTNSKADQQLRDQMWPADYAKAIEKRNQDFDALIKFETGGVSKSESLGDSLNLQMNQILLIVIAVGFFFSILVGYFIATFLVKHIGAAATQLSQGSSEVSDASEQLSKASQQLATGASTSAASLEEGVASIEELDSMVRVNAGNAQQAAGLSQQVRTQVETSLQESERLAKCMDDIQSSARKIEEIIGVIDDIAFQTNLLALNASVEAARAGDQGKGFSVVAEAVRGLALKSASSAKDISELIKQSVEQVAAGVAITKTNSSLMQSLNDAIKKISDLNQEIATASSEQSSGVNQLSIALNSLDKTVQGNAASSEEVAASAEELTAQSQSMKVNVTKLINIVDGASSHPPSEGHSHH
jgi:methyl-accepting chemotaxis protein